MRQQNRNNQLVNKLKMLLFTTLTAVFISAVLLVLSAVLLDKLGLNAGQVRILIYAVYIVSALAAGLIAGKWQRDHLACNRAGGQSFHEWYRNRRRRAVSGLCVHGGRRHAGRYAGVNAKLPAITLRLAPFLLTNHHNVV